MRWEQITSEWNKDFLGCQDLSYQAEEVGFLLATGSFNNPFTQGSVKTAYRTKTRSSGCIEFLFAPFYFILCLRPCQVQLSDIFRQMCVYTGSLRSHLFREEESYGAILCFAAKTPKGNRANRVSSRNVSGGLHSEFSVSVSKAEAFIWSLFDHLSQVNFSFKNRAKVSNLTTGHTPWENHNSKRCMYPRAHSSTVYSSQDVEAT